MDIAPDPRRSGNPTWLGHPWSTTPLPLKFAYMLSAVGSIWGALPEIANPVNVCAMARYRPVLCATHAATPLGKPLMDCLRWVVRRKGW